MKLIFLQVFVISMVTAEFQWFLSKKYNDCEDVPEKTFTGTPIAQKDAKHFVCWRDMNKNTEWKGETFKLGDCGDKCCDLISPGSTFIERKWRGSAWISGGCDQATAMEDFIRGPFYAVGVEGNEKKICISTKPTKEDNLSAFPVTMKIQTCSGECCVFGY